MILLYPSKHCSVLSSAMVLNLEFKLKEIAKGLLDMSTSFQQSANNREISFFELRRFKRVSSVIKITIGNWNIMRNERFHFALETTGLSRFKLSMKYLLEIGWTSRRVITNSFRRWNRKIEKRVTISSAFSQCNLR